MKRDKADAEWSDMIRERAEWTCQRCGKEYPPPTRALHACHIFSRGIKRTRHDPDNGFAADYGCHMYLDHHPLEKTAFAIKLLGKRRYEALERRARRVA